MKKEILKALYEAGENYISGVQLCEKLGVSRQAVWKNIAALKDIGYKIESIPNKGYHLLESPDCLFAPDIMSRLNEECIFQQVQCFEEVDSTNTRVKQLAEMGKEEGTVVAAEKQTAGKGRRGRSWNTKMDDAIAVTMLLRPQIPPEKVSAVTLLSALALAKSIQKIAKTKVQIKWPNDVIIEKHKICGILTEMSSEEEYIHYVAVGIGINVNQKSFPKELKEIASSIYLQTGKHINRCELTAELLNIFSQYYLQFVKDQNLSSFVEEYNQILANKDEQVKVYYGMVEEATPDNTDTGIARGIDQDGALLVEIEGTIKKIVSGEVSVRGLYGYV